MLRQVHHLALIFALCGIACHAIEAPFDQDPMQTTGDLAERGEQVAFHVSGLLKTNSGAT
ncbi:MAG: hypothetical protein ACI9F9_001424 [Candidatus Paceibacteria bacterium]|jgi:hypothetical protein